MMKSQVIEGQIGIRTVTGVCGQHELCFRGYGFGYSRYHAGGKTWGESLRSAG